MSTVASLTGELALAREAVAGRLRGVDPADFPAMRQAYDAFAENDPLPEGAGQSVIALGGLNCLGVLPQGASGDHVILWLHGGGFVLGSSVSHRGFVTEERERPAAERQIKDLSIKIGSPALPVSSLSGGNQQKVVVGNWLNNIKRLGSTSRSV